MLGSTANLRRLLVPAAVLGLAVAGCGQDLDREAAVDSFQRANPEASGAQAECVVDRQIDRLGLDGLTRQLEAETPSDDFVDSQFRDLFACGVDGDVEEQLVEQLEANGVTAEQAPCVADRLVGGLDDGDIDVLVSGQITDAFMAKFVAAMDGCRGAETGDD